MASCSRSEERLVNEQRRADLIKTRAAGATVPQGTARQRRLRRPSPLRIAFVLSIVVAACAAGILALAGRSLRPVEARDVVPPTTAPSTTTVSNGSSFIPSIGLTRTQVESLFREIDGSRTVFRAARALHGIPRVLGSDNRLYTIIEINGYPAVTDVQVVSILETTSKATLENQVLYDSLACSALGDKAAQNWYQPDLEHDFTWAGHRNRGGGLRPGAHHCEDLSVHKILRTCGRDRKHRTYVNPPFMPLVRPCPPCGG